MSACIDMFNTDLVYLISWHSVEGYAAGAVLLIFIDKIPLN